MKNTLWILVANSSEAKLYSTQKVNDDWDLVRRFNHPAGRKRDMEMVSDKSGNFPNISRGSSSFSEATDPKEAEAELFARHLTEELRLGRTRNQYHKLVLIAPPHFHGLLRKSCEQHVLDLVIKDLEKDYIGLAEHELIPRLREHLHSD